jgi:HEPN domain-containing protein
MPILPIEPRRFLRAGAHRLEEAQFLLGNSDYTTAAVYLAGYAVECTFKAVILASEPRGRHAATIQTFRRTQGHNFEWLHEQLEKRRVHLPANMTKELAKINGWTTSLRYDPVTYKRSDAEQFVLSVENLLEWLRARL